MRVLDVGCAKGYLVEAFRAQGVAQAVGLDVSVYAVSQAEPAVRGRLMVGNLVEGLPLATGTCDVITAMDLFEHLTDPVPALQEIAASYRAVAHP